MSTVGHLFQSRLILYMGEGVLISSLCLSVSLSACVCVCAKLIKRIRVADERLHKLRPPAHT